MSNKLSGHLLSILLDYAINTFLHLSNSAEIKRDRVFSFLIFRESKLRCLLNWPVHLTRVK